MAARWGAGMVTSEMLSAHGLARGDERAESMLQHDSPSCCFAAQIYGADPEVMARAARRVEAAGAHAVDINMGCPVKKVVKVGAGAALMLNPLLAEGIVRAVRRAVSVPLTVKIRSGWDQSQLNYEEVAQRAADQGADAISVHPRTRAQGFSGKADWSHIGRIVKAVSICVIGNGDVNSPLDAANLLRQTGCHGVMIGRGALGRPWIFTQMAQYLRGEPLSDSPGGERLLKEILDHLHWAAQQPRQRGAVSRMHRHIAWYTRGLHHVSLLRKSIPLTRDFPSMEQNLISYFLALEKYRSDKSPDHMRDLTGSGNN